MIRMKISTYTYNIRSSSTSLDDQERLAHQFFQLAAILLRRDRDWLNLFPSETKSKHANYFRMNTNRRKNSGKSSKHLFGIGLDCHDGHKRITTSEDFSVIGGSDETHAKVSETFIKTFEYFSAKNKTLDEISSEKLAELLRINTPEWVFRGFTPLLSDQFELPV